MAPRAISADQLLRLGWVSDLAIEEVPVEAIVRGIFSAADRLAAQLDTRCDVLYGKIDGHLHV